MSSQYSNHTNHFGLVQSGHHHHHHLIELVIVTIYLTNLSLGVNDNRSWSLIHICRLYISLFSKDSLISRDVWNHAITELPVKTTNERQIYEIWRQNLVVYLSNMYGRLPDQQKDVYCDVSSFNGSYVMDSNKYKFSAIGD